MHISQSIHQLSSRNLIRSQFIQALQNTLKATTAAVDKRLRSLQLALLKQLSANLPELLRKLKLLRLSRSLLPLEESLAKDRVHKRDVRSVDLGVHIKQLLLLDWQKSSVLAALGADSPSADGDALCGTVPSELEGVVGVLTNFLSDIG